MWALRVIGVTSIFPFYVIIIRIYNLNQKLEVIIRKLVGCYELTSKKNSEFRLKMTIIIVSDKCYIIQSNLN